jgi:hypothetical protein
VAKFSASLCVLCGKNSSRPIFAPSRRGFGCGFAALGNLWITPPFPLVLNLRILDFEFVSDFELRISDFLLTNPLTSDIDQTGRTSGSMGPVVAP